MPLCLLLYHLHITNIFWKHVQQSGVTQHSTPSYRKWKHYGVELSEMLYISTLHNIGTLYLEFVEYVVDKIVNVHTNDKDTPPVTVIEWSYNTESGACYYFTPHGNQIRRQPKYAIDAVNKNYDDVPGVDEVCKKKFPSVSYGGYGYMFLWLCPIHGHCYGFHLIACSVGRKDPFSSLLNTYQQHLKKFSMTLPANIVNIVWIENHSISPNKILAWLVPQYYIQM